MRRKQLFLLTVILLQSFVYTSLQAEEASTSTTPQPSQTNPTSSAGSVAQKNTVLGLIPTNTETPPIVGAGMPDYTSDPVGTSGTNPKRTVTYQGYTKNVQIETTAVSGAINLFGGQTTTSSITYELYTWNFTANTWVLGQKEGSETAETKWKLSISGGVDEGHDTKTYKLSWPVTNGTPGTLSKQITSENFFQVKTDSLDRIYYEEIWVQKNGDPKTRDGRKSEKQYFANTPGRVKAEYDLKIQHSDSVDWFPDGREHTVVFDCFTNTSSQDVTRTTETSKESGVVKSQSVLDNDVKYELTPAGDRDYVRSQLRKLIRTVTGVGTTTDIFTQYVTGNLRTLSRLVREPNGDSTDATVVQHYRTGTIYKIDVFRTVGGVTTHRTWNTGDPEDPSISNVIYWIKNTSPAGAPVA